MRKFDLSLRSSRSSYFATFRHQLTILSKTDALDEEKWLNMLGTFVKDWFRYESHFVHGRDSLVDILKERGLLSESDAVQPRSEERRVGKEWRSRWPPARYIRNNILNPSTTAPLPMSNHFSLALGIGTQNRAGDCRQVFCFFFQAEDGIRDRSRHSC